MRLDDLIKPISPDAPCGEDLLALDDPDYCDYYFNVEDRLPTSYFNMVRGTLFDAKSVDQKAESAQIDALLKRSRDLRLLGLEAKFQILAGRFKGFADAVMGFAGLIEAYPGDVHPVDAVDRRNAIEELNALATIAAPLDYAILLTDKRIGDVIYRGYGTASGKIPTREGEQPGDVGNITGALSSAENAKAVDALYAQLTGLRAAIKTIVQLCQSGAQPFAPKLDRLDDKLADILAMVVAARGDLGAAVAPVVEGTEGEAAAPISAGAATTITVQTGTTEVPNHRIAYQLLQAVERYFATTEPASLALVLVTQSRLLIGRPLVEALDALLENSAGYATISFGTETGFAISMARMRDLSGQANIASDDYATPDENDPAAPEVVSRDHAGQILKQIEDFFRMREPASPIPILLFKARNMLSKDFHALVRELIPPS
ncbi:MAG: type VI secretion system ImpA family N-terminal domain-containing protein [Cypionkella sp.]|uniref:type VI secretion system protein TssA n=1 Tax=Cypionkella sp. TaxID=2811411 RepID=UPI002AB95643|nr:type VI secretion system ImpA family N-terminal domain-containing protein [Cypionkella sp.]MDZ4309129.1 type VI secretion system ImpA family N-terminal domain-containing protein [Cypionkella sp.]